MEFVDRYLSCVNEISEKLDKQQFKNVVELIDEVRSKETFQI